MTARRHRGDARVDVVRGRGLDPGPTLLDERAAERNFVRGVGAVFALARVALAATLRLRKSLVDTLAVRIEHPKHRSLGRVLRVRAGLSRGFTLVAHGGSKDVKRRGLTRAVAGDVVSHFGGARFGFRGGVFGRFRRLFRGGALADGVGKVLLHLAQALGDAHEVRLRLDASRALALELGAGLVELRGIDEGVERRDEKLADVRRLGLDVALRALAAVAALLAVQPLEDTRVAEAVAAREARDLVRAAHRRRLEADAASQSVAGLTARR